MTAPIEWVRCTPLSWGEPSARQERWECWQGGALMRSYPVDVRLGKPLDVLALKGASLQETRDYARYLADTAKTLYGSDIPPVVLAACPCCGRDAADARVTVVVHGVPHHRCGGCAHVFIREQPHPDARAQLFTESDEHSAVYTDQAAIEVRMRQVVQPKIAWVEEVYRKHYGHAFSRVLDVGAGGGHFVAALRARGIAADGFELSRSSRRFAAQAFGLDLSDVEFLGAAPPAEPYDVITFFGMLEYTGQPAAYIEAARRWLHPTRGLLVAEVPRVDCLGTAVQRELSDNIARHFGPTSHVHCFSDAGVATCLHRAALAPIAAWYFGMDAYELLVQQALALNDDSLLPRLVTLVPSLQRALDAAALCDDLIVAAVPLSEGRSGESPAEQ